MAIAAIRKVHFIAAIAIFKVKLLSAPATSESLTGLHAVFPLLIKLLDSSQSDVQNLHRQLVRKAIGNEWIEDN